MGNWGGIDFFIFLIFVLNTILGLSRGASKEIISMISLNVALIFMIKFTMPLTLFLGRSPVTQNVLSTPMIQNFMAAIGAGSLTAELLHELTYCLSLLICFTGAFCACEAVISVTSVIELMSFSTSTWNRKLGGTLGFLRGYILNVLFILILSHLYSLTNVITNGSYFVQLFDATGRKVDALIGKQEVERYKEIYQDKDLFNKENMLQELQSTVPPEQPPPPPTTPP